MIKSIVAATLMLASSTSAADRSDHGLSTELVKQPRIESKAIRKFNDGLASIGSSAHVTHCSELRWAHLGRVQTVYGGKCALSNRIEVAICADTAVGFFALSYDADVADFMDNCWG